MRRGALGAVAICVAAALWGIDGVALTPRLFALDVLFVVFLLHAVPFVLMQPFLAGSYGALARLAPRDWGVLLLVSLAGGILGTFSIVKALFLVDFQQLSVVVLLQKLQPVFAIGLAAVVLRERISPRFLGRAALALAGAYLLTFGLRHAGGGARASTGWRRPSGPCWRRPRSARPPCWASGCSACSAFARPRSAATA